MSAPISTIMEQHVRTVGMEDTVEKVEAVMAETGLSAVPVVDDKGVVFGVISVSDLLFFNVKRKKPAAVRAWEICTHRVIECGPDASTVEVARLMLKHNVHHIVVVGTDRSLMGIVSSLDFVRDYLARSA